MPHPQGSMSREVRSVIRDRYGNVILSLSVTDVLIRGPNNETSRQRLNDNIQLVCGTIYNPAMSTGQNPVVLISVCERCRAPRTSLLSHHVPTHGLCSTEAGAHCRDCGEFLCPRHQVRYRDGGAWCETCFRRARMRRFLRNVFFKVE